MPHPLSHVSRPLRRVRLEVEALEGKVLPSASLHTVAFAVVDNAPAVHVAQIKPPSKLAEFNGVYKINFSGQITPPLSMQTESVQGYVSIRLANGAITAFGAHATGHISSSGVLTANVSFKNIVLNFHGQIKVTHTGATLSGTWTGSYLSIAGHGTWHASRTGK
jgi:hypothetical protein